MHIYRCELILMEATFFSSREVSAIYQTEPLIGNIALAYALGFCQAPYFNDGAIHYQAHLSQLNERGVYITPGTILGQPRFTLSQFNAQADAHWYAFANNVIVTRPDGAWTEKGGQAWYVLWPDGRRQKVGLENRPQHGRLRLLAIGNRARAYVLSDQPQAIPHYVRLGKFMSKARVEVTEMAYREEERVDQVVPFLLNPADLPREMSPRAFDLVSVPPTPLVRNTWLSGRFFCMVDNVLLPVGMRFAVDNLP